MDFNIVETAETKFEIINKKLIKKQQQHHNFERRRGYQDVIDLMII